MISNPVLINKIYYNSTRAAATGIGVDHVTIKNRIESKNFPEYSYTEYQAPKEKKCPKCGNIKLLEQFKKRKASRDGRSAWCKKCWSQFVVQNTIDENKKRNSAKYRKTTKGRSLSKLGKSQRRELAKACMTNLSSDEKKYIRWLHDKVSVMRKHGFDVHLDHIIPISKGGLHVPENLQIIHAEDNLRKTNKLTNHAA